MASLTAGFETVNAQLGLILLPLALDLLLWLGPHVSAQPRQLLEDTLRWLGGSLSPADAEIFQALVDSLQQSLASQTEPINLLAALSTTPLGVPALLAAQRPNVTPWGAAQTWLVESYLAYLVLFGALTLIGLLLGALYFGGVAQQVRDARIDLGLLLRQVWGDWARITALALLAVLATFLVGAPTTVMALTLGAFSPLLRDLVGLLGATLVLWVMLFGAFALPGIVLQRRGLLGAVWDSVRLAQASLPQTTGLFVAVTLVNLGLGFVWSLPRADSWWLLIGLAGHALVSTALIAATFVFYKDRYRWWVEMQQALRDQRAAA